MTGFWADVATWAGGITVILGCLALLYRLLLRAPVARVRSFLEWNDRFREEWEGTALDPDRPWEPHSPGVLQRLNDLDGEFHDDGNGSLKSSVRRIERAVTAMSDQVTEALNRMDRRITALEKRTDI